ncbi:MAG: UDP-N-acetylmuramate--L-alanine ligase [Bdellovibrionales bacterium]
MTFLSNSFDPQNVGLIHFIGIGGIGMSGIAEIMHAHGYQIQGSDLNENGNVRRLRDKGMKVFVGHNADNLGAAAVVVISSAIKKNNPELIAARAKFLPIVRRAEMLGELMRNKRAIGVGGTHGKTTTTSMVATLFDAASLDPTVINGGIINAYGTNARLGSSDWMVVETDESDGSFMKLPSTITIVTNMDAEHLDYYKDFDSIKRAYTSFIEQIPFYGFAVLCIDHPEVQALAARIEDRRVITYGLSAQADVRAVNLKTDSSGAAFDVHFSSRTQEKTKIIENIRLPLIGLHNVQNCLAALAVGWQLGFEDKVLREGLASFEGVKRRFTKTGQVNDITIIDDYAHHPTEIKATLRAALQARGPSQKTIAVLQPHRYSRLHSLFEDFCTSFNDADIVIVADVYPAGEDPIEGADKNALVAGLHAHGMRNIHALEGPDALAPLIQELASSGDYVICLGAGSVSQWAYALPKQLEEIKA